MERRIDQVKNRKARNVQYVEFIDKQRIRIVFKNNQEIVLRANPTDYGYDAVIYIEKDTV